MRLINAKTLKLEDVGSNPREYAILSHTWGDDEITFEEMMAGTGTSKAGFVKIFRTCQQAKADGLEYAWIDTCCIDKSSSSELSESINSMVWWYHKARVCYVYLEDVPARRTFEEARWFSRGWTLQELLAPKRVRFYDHQWRELGTRERWARSIEQATKIDWESLQGENTLAYVRSTSVAKRMAWAAKRQVTRAEDIAYCLLGLFDVSMPLLYGEGGPKAFERLQEEIIKRHLDHSFLVATGFSNRMHGMNDIPLFAHSPSFFKGCENVLTTGETVAPFSLNNQGLQLRIPIFQVSGHRNKYIAVLACVRGLGSTQRLGLRLRATERTATILIREAIKLYEVSEVEARTASIRDCCILRRVPIAVPRVLSICVINDWLAISRRETLYQKNSKDRKKGWQQLEAGGDIIRVPPPDKNNYISPCYGVVFANPEIRQPGDNNGSHRPTLEPSTPGRSNKILVRIDLDVTSRYSATISIDHFWDQNWGLCNDLSIVPNTAVSRIAQATTQTLDLGRDEQPKRLVASISWKRTAGQEVLRLDIKIIDSSTWGRIKAIFPSLNVSPETPDILVYWAAFTVTAMFIQDFTQFWGCLFFACRLAEIEPQDSELSLTEIDVGPPNIWNRTKWALCVPAFAILWPMAPSTVHQLLITTWPVRLKLFGYEGVIGLWMSYVLLVAGLVLVDGLETK